MLDAPLLEYHLDDHPYFRRVRLFESVPSSNALLEDELRSGMPAGEVVVARHQTQGRGRRDRAWEEAPGSSLLVSVSLPASLSSVRTWGVLAAALSIRQAAAACFGIDAELKWPNDVLVNRRKVAGILGAHVADGLGRGVADVVGSGINVNWGGTIRAQYPEAISFDEVAGSTLSLDALLEAYLEAWRHRDPQTVIAEFDSACSTIGQFVRIELHDSSVEGEAIALSETGALVLRTEAGETEYHAGDVVHLRPA